MGDSQRVARCAVTVKGSGLSHWADCAVHGKVDEGNGPVAGSRAKVEAAAARHAEHHAGA